MELSQVVRSSMTQFEHNELRHLTRRYVELVEAYSTKLNFDLPHGMSLDEIQDLMNTANVMLEAFQLSMAEKYPLKPLVGVSPFKSNYVTFAEKQKIVKQFFEEEERKKKDKEKK